MYLLKSHLDLWFTVPKAEGVIEVNSHTSLPQAAGGNPQTQPCYESETCDYLNQNFLACLTPCKECSVSRDCYFHQENPMKRRTNVILICRVSQNMQVSGLCLLLDQNYVEINQCQAHSTRELVWVFLISSTVIKKPHFLLSPPPPLSYWNRC